MKNVFYVCLIALSVLTLNAPAQNSSGGLPEQHNRTLNIGLGIGYYGYVGHSIPVFMLNEEFDVARNFTLAPFIGLYTFSNSYYWGNNNNPYRYYTYRETTIPLGVKAIYYFDELLQAAPRWDFYAAASIGFSLHFTTWDDGYYGDKTVANESSPLYADLHIGTRYHLNHRTGIFLDLSTGQSSAGLSFRL